MIDNKPFNTIQVFGPFLLMLTGLNCQPAESATHTSIVSQSDVTQAVDDIIGDTARLDTAAYHRKLLDLVHEQPSETWPAKTPYPLPGALLPFNRIIAYYGNLYSKGMGILGQLPPEQMLGKLQEEVRHWEKADSLTPVIPALHYIAVTAQLQPGSGGAYRLRMPGHQIDKVLELAAQINALVFLDIQIGHSSLEAELPLFRDYLLLPHVHIGIDPEYSMKGKGIPGSRIGSMDASDINFASGYLAELVRENGLTPKILVVHRFNKAMVTNYRKIITRPEVQIVMHMDGFGFPAKKINSYKNAVASEPVQFTGFKIFYKNDIHDPRWPKLMQPGEILALYPKPVYIQYQ